MNASTQYNSTTKNAATGASIATPALLAVAAATTFRTRRCGGRDRSSASPGLDRRTDGGLAPVPYRQTTTRNSIVEEEEDEDEEKEEEECTIRDESHHLRNDSTMDIDAHIEDASDDDNDSETGSVSWHPHRQTNENRLECDFYENPTLLSRLILHQKYAAALRRVRQHPTEAHTWVCRLPAVPPPAATTPLEPTPLETDANDIAKAEKNANASKEQPNMTRHRYPTTLIPSFAQGVYNPHRRHSRSHHKPQQARHPPSPPTPACRRDSAYSFRQLPIHMACQNLGLYHHHHRAGHSTNNTVRGDLDRLLTQLIITYPAGCQYSDHAGHFPLHRCIRMRASLEIITLLLTAAPKTMMSLDGSAQTSVFMANSNNSKNTNHDDNEDDDENEAGAVRLKKKKLQRQDRHRERIEKLLRKGCDFWGTVRQRAMEQRKARKIIESANPSTKPHSSSGQAAVADASVDHDTIWSDHCKQEDQPSLDESSSLLVSPMAWSQLEQRCNILEQLLTEQMSESNENNPKSEVQSTTAGLIEETRRLQQTILQLENQNRTYQDRITELEGNVKNLLWVSSVAGGGGALSADRSGLASEDEYVVESHAVSSLSFSEIVETPTKATQPRGMFGETSIASTIHPAASFESSDLEEELPKKTINTNGNNRNNNRQTPSSRSATISNDVVLVGMGEPDGHLGLRHRTNVDNFLCEPDSDEESDLDSILAEAELQNGSKLSADVVRAWKAITVDSDTEMRSTHEDEDTSEILQGVEYAGSNGPFDESLTEGGLQSPRRRDWRTVSQIVVSPIQD